VYIGLPQAQTLRLAILLSPTQLRRGVLLSEEDSVEFGHVIKSVTKLLRVLHPTGAMHKLRSEKLAQYCFVISLLRWHIEPLIKRKDQ